MSSKRRISSSSTHDSHSKRICLSSSYQSIAPSTSLDSSASTSTSTSTGPIYKHQTLTLNASTLSDELFLEVFSYLSPWDLSMVERVDRHFLRLANDPLLWRRLYMTASPYANSLRGSRSSTPSRRPTIIGAHSHSIPTPTKTVTVDVSAYNSSSSPVKIRRFTDHEHEQRDILPLPSRRRKTENGERSNINWKEMFRISTNWSSGRSTLTPLSTPKRALTGSQPASHTSPSTPSDSSRLDPQPLSSPESKSIQPRTILALLHPVILHAVRSATSSSLPEIQAFLTSRLSDPSDPIGRQTKHLAQVGELVASFISPGLRKERETGWLRGEVWITDLSVDKQDGSSRVYVGYSSGAISILTVDLPDVVLSRKSGSILSSHLSSSTPSLENDFDGEVIVHESYFQPSPTVPPLSLPIISALYGSLLVTCTDEFSLSFYTIPDEAHSQKNNPNSRTQGTKPFKTVKSHTSWFPASISINPFPFSQPISALSSSLSDNEEERRASMKSDDRVVVSIGFSIPVYPDQWTVSIQQFQLRAPSAQSTSHTGADWTWIDDRILSALMPSVPFTYSYGSSPESSSRIRGPTEIGSVGKVSSLAVDGRWICLAGEDNRVQIFEIPAEAWGGLWKRDSGVPSREKVKEGRPGRKDRLMWRHTLWDHHAAVTSVSCLDGRCITVDSTGRLLIWSLDQPFDPEGLSPLPQSLRSVPLPAIAFSQPPTTLPSSSSSSSSFLKFGLTSRPSTSSGLDEEEDTKDEATFVEVLKPRFKPFVDPSSPIHHSPDARTVCQTGDCSSDTKTMDSKERPDSEESQVRGKEHIRWVGQDAMTVVTISTARIGEGQRDERSEDEERIKVWGFDG